MAASVLDRVDAMLESVRHDIEQGISPKLTVKTGGKRVFDESKGLFTETARPKMVRFLSANAKEVAQFVMLVRVLGIVKGALEQNRQINKRDLYYQDVELFNSQENVDRTVACISTTLQVTRLDLNIVTTSKGVVSGSMTIFGTNGMITEVVGTCSIPACEEIRFVRLNQPVDYILVVEKDAVFQHLSRPNSIVITGKGFPDAATRRLLHVLDKSYAKIPLYALVDSDPSGLQILSTYKYGSATMANENAKLVAPRIQYLGVKITEFTQGWLDMSKRDFTLAKSMLKKQWMQSDETKEWKRQLQMSMFLYKKAELNVAMDSQIEQYLDSKLFI